MIFGSKDKLAWLLGAALCVASLLLDGPAAVLTLIVGMAFTTGGAFAGGCRVSDEEHSEIANNFGLPR